MNVIRILLFPIACFYGLIMHIRNKFFDWGILTTKSFDIPIISVGNLSFGGTGKTPLIEYIIRLLSDNYIVSTLSRGYGRKTKGFVLANEFSSYYEIGDEPVQYCQKFKNVLVAVDENRKRGIKILYNIKSDLDSILLDDAFQHRYVKPGLSILLTDFHKLFVNDYILPTGTLREFRKGFKRADIIIITKTNVVFSPITKRRVTNLIKPLGHQSLYFTYIEYGDKIAVTDIADDLFEKKNYNTIVLFTGIANPYPLQEHLKRFCSELIVLNFPDHHKYTERDIKKIKTTYLNVFSKNKIIFTTEKDTMRLMKTNLYEKIKNLPICYIPIQVKFHFDEGKKFDNQILSFIEKNKR